MGRGLWWYPGEPASVGACGTDVRMPRVYSELDQPASWGPAEWVRGWRLGRGPGWQSTLLVLGGPEHVRVPA